MIKVNVLSEEKSWTKKIKKKEIFFNNLCKFFPKKFKFINKKIYFTLLLSNNKNIKRLNKKFRNKNNITDVLSFPFYNKRVLKNKLRKEKEIYIGDIIINFNKIKNKNNKVSFKSELNKLWVHGLVHLFGYDHKKDKDFYKMRKMEKKLLSHLY